MVSGVGYINTKIHMKALIHTYIHSRGNINNNDKYNNHNHNNTVIIIIIIIIITIIIIIIIINMSLVNF